LDRLRAKSVPPSLPLYSLIPVDLGTGSGKWVIEVAKELPSTRVIGIDLSPIQPTLVPTNAEFLVEDVIQGISLSDSSTDLVHSRYLLH
jgi:methylase of polypeptide subunit release factors